MYKAHWSWRGYIILLLCCLTVTPFACHATEAGSDIMYQNWWLHIVTLILRTRTGPLYMYSAYNSQGSVLCQRNANGCTNAGTMPFLSGKVLFLCLYLFETNPLAQQWTDGLSWGSAVDRETLDGPLWPARWGSYHRHRPAGSRVIFGSLASLTIVEEGKQWRSA